MTKEEIIKDIEDNKDEYIKFFQTLVQKDSYNPPGNENNVAVEIEKYLSDTNIKYETFPFGDNRANMLISLNEQYDLCLLYNAHMDVVPPGSEEEWKYPPLSGFIKRNKYIFGRGTADMKAALAAMIITVKILNKLDLDTSKNLIVNAVADEETGGKLGTGWSLENILKPRSINCEFVVVGEASGLNPLPKAIIIGEKGHLIIKIVTNGKSAHSMAPTMGINAIYMISKIIQNLDKLPDFIPKIDPPFSLEELKQMIGKAFISQERFDQIYNDQELLRSIMNTLTEFTYSLNVINGGVKVNIIPDKCEALIDFRLLPGQSSKMIMDGLKKLIESLGYQVADQTLEKNPDDGFVHIEIYNEGAASLWREFRKSRLTTEFKEIADYIYGKRSFYFMAPGSTDAHYYRNDGFCEKTIHFGPGSAGSMHAINESLELQDFINSLKVYALFAYHYLTTE